MINRAIALLLSLIVAASVFANCTDCNSQCEDGKCEKAESEKSSQ